MLTENIWYLIDALESGDFEQTECQLKWTVYDASGIRTACYYCVLGVACEVYRLRTGHGAWVSKVRPYGDNTGLFDVGLDTQYWIELPQCVKKWYGFASTVGHCETDFATPGLSTLNDDGQSFRDIAALLRTKAEAQLGKGCI